MACHIYEKRSSRASRGCNRPSSTEHCTAQTSQAELQLITGVKRLFLMSQSEAVIYEKVQEMSVQYISFCHKLQSMYIKYVTYTHKTNLVVGGAENSLCLKNLF